MASFNGGSTSKSFISTADNNANVLSPSSGNVYSLQCGNINAAPRYLKLYDKATNPNPATDTPVLVVMIPGNTTGAGNNVVIPEQGIKFQNGIAFLIVNGMANTDNTSIGAAEVCTNFQF